ncbi:T9SS type B sorting domain-containing protein [Flavobacterium orientale]|uniref:T9SS C-terminal target domain-containing protein n=1 Tax=Flavobacterium orientale TaxID=1756020 RepID=A0A916Y580_9FLAO|nr:choice-of-anchor L domain-containing protein [Flavobacterium orientale]GGD31400.1 T9SS C-terminal target domain-containing protein [Flavobacterium orientale]
MIISKKINLSLFIIGSYLTSFAQSITVDDSYTANQLVENVLINSPCANVSNISVSGWDTSQNGTSYGYFTNVSNAFPFANGVILATGRAVSAIGPNNSLLSEGPTTWLGDGDLEQAIGESNTINATVLEFDFLPLATKVSFEYVFSSEQYLSNPNSNQCNFSDGFAFLLREVGSSNQYQNLAVVPGTNVPVKITTVRGPGTICPQANPQYFDAFNGTDHPTNYNGQTKVLKAEATVTPGVLYHIKLVVADQGNQFYDSAIFLGGGSFKVEIDLGPDRLFATSNPVCSGETYELDGTQAGNNTYQWFKNGIVIANATQPLYTVTDSGIYSVEVTLQSSTCIARGEVVVEYSNLPDANPASIQECDPDGDGTTTFNLNQLIPTITNNNPQAVTIFYPSLLDAQNFTNSIQNTSAYNSIATTIYASVFNNYSCKTTVPITLNISTDSIATPQPFTICDSDGTSDGITTFNLGASITPTLLNGQPSGLSVAYYDSIANALNQTNALATNYTNSTPFNQIIYARVNSGSSCYDIVTINIQIISFQGAFASEDKTICDGGNLLLTAPVGNFTYLWNTGATTNSIQINNPGSYTVSITNSSGCSADKIFIVTASQSPEIISVTVNDFNGGNNSLQIISGATTDSYSLDGVIYQNSSLFTNLLPGLYTVYVKDQNECGVDFQQIRILDYPKFFTPNGDSYNDIWQIQFLDLNKSKLYIFDRYGKLLIELTTRIPFWDGTFNGQSLPASDYWFVLQFEDGGLIKSHFSLIR